MKDRENGEYREREERCSSSGKKRRSKMEEGKRGDRGGGIARACTECGKKFWSWKALFGHMRCHPERQWRGINPPPNFRRGQQQQHSSVMTPEDHEVAASLLLLANSNANAKGNKLKGVMGVEEDCSAECGSQFECSSCNKVFGSHQALGGHRASHKNVKGCFANAIPVTTTTARMTWTQGDTFVAADHQDHQHNYNNNVMMLRSGIGEGEGDESGGHKCSICLRVFNTGQALGGHKRCHWDRGDHLLDPSPSPSSASKSLVDLNLPLPPPLDADADADDHPPCSSSPLTLDLRLGL